MSGTDPGDKSSAQIEREVEQTRSNVADTLDTLRNKLQPGQMVDQVVGQMSDYVRSSAGRSSCATSAPPCVTTPCQWR
jgi:hypothetical protein